MRLAQRHALRDLLPSLPSALTPTLACMVHCLCTQKRAQLRLLEALSPDAASTAQGAEDVGMARYKLATWYYSGDLLQEAGGAARQAAATFRKAFPEEHDLVRPGISSVSVLVVWKIRVMGGKARPCWLALPLCCSCAVHSLTAGRRLPQVALCKHRLGMVCAAAGDWRSAKKLLEESAARYGGMEAAGGLTAEARFGLAAAAYRGGGAAGQEQAAGDMRTQLEAMASAMGASHMLVKSAARVLSQLCSK